MRGRKFSNDYVKGSDITPVLINDVGAKHLDDYLLGNPKSLFPNASPWLRWGRAKHSDRKILVELRILSPECFAPTTDFIAMGSVPSSIRQPYLFSSVL